MSIIISRALCLTCALVTLPAHAADWSISGGATLREARSTLPGAENTDRGWSTNAMLTKQAGKWTLGGGLSYSLSTIKTDDDTGHYRPAATSAVAMASRDIGDGRSVSATLGYGDSAVNSSQVSGTTTTSYTARSDFLSGSVSLTQAISLSRRSLMILSARYTNVGSRSHSYTNSAGNATQGSDTSFGFYSLGAGYSHRFGRTTAYVQTDWNTASKEFVGGTGDKDYFNISTGLNYRLDSKTNLGLSFSTVANKAYSHDNSIGVNVRYAF